jgi:hypothetical protein
MNNLYFQRKFSLGATHSKINKGVPQELLFYGLSLHPPCIPTVRNPYVYIVYCTRFMITSETPYKLAEIIRDTWPGLYRKPEPSYNEKKKSENEKV